MAKIRVGSYQRQVERRGGGEMKYTSWSILSCGLVLCCCLRSFCVCVSVYDCDDFRFVSLLVTSKINQNAPAKEPEDDWVLFEGDMTLVFLPY